jgi:hypothetical protein
MASVVVLPPLPLPPDDEPDEELDDPEDEPEDPPELPLDASPPDASGLPCPSPPLLLLLHAAARTRTSVEESPRSHGVRLM